MLTVGGDVVFQVPWKDHGNLPCSFWPYDLSLRRLIHKVNIIFFQASLQKTWSVCVLKGFVMFLQP